VGVTGRGGVGKGSYCQVQDREGRQNICMEMGRRKKGRKVKQINE
jgi:hypothetical protein